MANTTAKALDNGPLLVNGNIELTDGEGNRMETSEETYFCRCGLSDNAPFCTGAHEGKFHNTVRAK